MGRNALLIGGLVVAGAIVALVLALKKDDTHGRHGRSPTAAGASPTGSTPGTSAPGDSTAMTPGSTSSGSSPGASTDVPAGAGAVQAGGPGAVATSVDPRVPVVTDSHEPRAPRDPSGSTAEYKVGNLGVRDHRGSNAAPVDVPPNVHPPGETLIDSTLTNEIGQKVRAVIYACAREAGREGRGTSPRVEGQFVIDVHAHELKVSSALFQVRDLAEAPASQIKQCVEGKVVGLTVPAPQQDDVASYGINVTLRLP